MEISLSHNDWRVLRAVLRSRQPAKGGTLRLDMSRRTKDGAFLPSLVQLGLLRVAQAGETPFDAAYALTDRGKQAAEFGVYDIDWEEYKEAIAKTDEGRVRSKRGRPKKG